MRHNWELEESNRANETGSRNYEQTIREISKAYNKLNLDTNQAILSAQQWRDETLAGLDQTQAGYETFHNQVEEIYTHMLAEARGKDLQNSTYWADGIKRSLNEVMSSAQDTASQTENIVKNAFKGLEDAFVSFVISGKLDFKSLVHSMIADLIRLQLRKNLLGPLVNALGGK